MSRERVHSMFGGLRKKLTRSKHGTNPSWCPGSGDECKKAQVMPSDTFVALAPATERSNSSSINPFCHPKEANPLYTPEPAYYCDSAFVPSKAPSTDADPYAFLASFDTVFLIDDSGSMAGCSWRETSKALQTITPICTQQDTDGIDIYFLNQSDSVTSARTIFDTFQSVRPKGPTPTGQRLNQILKPYLQQYERNPDIPKPSNVILITDGEPSDDVESPCIKAAKKLDKLDTPAWQVGIQFFQVEHDHQSGGALQKRHAERLERTEAPMWQNGVPFLKDLYVPGPLFWASTLISRAWSHPVRETSANDNSTWTERALRPLTEIPVFLANMLVPVVVLTVAGYMATYFHKTKAPGKAALSLLGTAAIFLTNRKSTDAVVTSGDRYADLSVGLAYSFFVAVYCKLIGTQNGAGKVFYTGALALASLATLVLMAIEPVRTYWTQLTTLDPAFALALSIPSGFAICDVALDLSKRLNGRN